MSPRSLLAAAQPPDLNFPIHSSGPLHDDLNLRLLDAAADVFVTPSRQDNLPNTGLEVHACGTPWWPSPSAATMCCNR